MFRSLKEHWPEYFCEAAGLGLFMISASLFTLLLWPSISPVLSLIPIAFIAELIIAFILMTVVLNVSNTPHLARFTGIFAGCLVATYITLEAPFSGMSMNPARTFSSAFVGHLWTGLWIYFIAPVLAMQ